MDDPLSVNDPLWGYPVELVGGPKDGTVMAVPHDTYTLRMPVLREPMMFTANSDPTQLLVPTMKVEVYERAGRHDSGVVWVRYTGTV